MSLMGYGNIMGVRIPCNLDTNGIEALLRSLYLSRSSLGLR